VGVTPTTVPLFIDLPPVELPGPRPTPVFGYRANVIRLLSDPVSMMLRLHAEYGEIAALTRNHPGWVLAAGARYNQQVLADPLWFHNFAETPIAVPPESAARIVNLNITAQNGEAHRRARRMMMPAFAKARLQGYGSTMVELATRALEAWPTSGPVDVRTEMIALTMDIAMACLFGIRGDAEHRQLGRLSLKVLEQMVRPATLMFPFQLPGTAYSRYLATAEQLALGVRKLIATRRAEGLGDDVFSALIDAADEEGQRFSEAELVGQANVLVVAGHETTANTLCWTAMLLATHPEIQHAVADEIAAVLRGAAPTLDDLERMPLLNHIVDESMRLLPTTPMLFLRRCVDPFELEGRAMPVGSTVLLSPLLTHRDPELYPEPRRFRPQRWESLRPTAYEYLPFGAGPRRCIGAGFAGQAIRLILAVLLQRRRLAMPSAMRVDRKFVGIVMGPQQMTLQVAPADAKIAAPAQLSGGVLDLLDLGGG
jgi:cytochrome P450